MSRYVAPHRLGGCPHLATDGRSLYGYRVLFVGFMTEGENIGEAIYRCTRCGEIFIAPEARRNQSLGRPRTFRK